MNKRIMLTKDLGGNNCGFLLERPSPGSGYGEERFDLRVGGP